MIKVSVMYPHAAGARFDHEYYRARHMPMCARLFGPACRGYEIDRGLAGGEPGSPPPYAAMCHFLFDSVEAFQGAFGPHAAEIMADVPRYTDLAPVVQISEVVEGRG